MKNLRVLVVDDHPLMREAVCSAIQVEEDLEVAGRAAGGLEALQLARTLRPDVIIMDLLMPGMDGLEAIAALRAEDPQARILALTSSTDESKVLQAVRAGALGYLLKDAQREEIIAAIRLVGQGEVYLPPAIAAQLVHGVRQNQADPLAHSTNPTGPLSPPPLTERQLVVLDMLGLGWSNAQIGTALALSENTVRSHVSHMLDRLNLQTRHQLVAYAVERRLKGPRPRAE